MLSAPLPRVLTAANVGSLDVTRSRIRAELRRGNWRQLWTGVVLTRPDEPTRADWATVGVAVAGAGSAISGWDAIRARGAGSSEPPCDKVLILTPTGTSRVVGGVLIRPTDRPFRCAPQPFGAPLEFLPLVHPARATADCALAHGVDLNSVRALVGRVLQRKLCTLDELVTEYGHGPRRDSHSLRLALIDAADGARSAAEAQVARRLARADIPAFELNVPVVDRNGRPMREIDVLWRTLRAGIEIDSRAFHFEVLDWEGTMSRHNEVTGYRLALLHYSPAAIRRAGTNFVREVDEFLRDRAAELGVPLPKERGIIRPTSSDGRPPPWVIPR